MADDPDYQPEPLIIRRGEPKPTLIGTAAEDIKAGQTIVVDFATGMVRPWTGGR